MIKTKLTADEEEETKSQERANMLLSVFGVKKNFIALTNFYEKYKLSDIHDPQIMTNLNAVLKPFEFKQFFFLLQEKYEKYQNSPHCYRIINHYLSLVNTDHGSKFLVEKISSAIEDPSLDLWILDLIFDISSQKNKKNLVMRLWKTTCQVDHFSKNHADRLTTLITYIGSYLMDTSQDSEEHTLIKMFEDIPKTTPWSSELLFKLNHMAYENLENMHLGYLSDYLQTLPINSTAFCLPDGSQICTSSELSHLCLTDDRSEIPHQISLIRESVNQADEQLKSTCPKEEQDKVILQLKKILFSLTQVVEMTTNQLSESQSLVLDQTRFSEISMLLEKIIIILKKDTQLDDSCYAQFYFLDEHIKKLYRLLISRKVDINPQLLKTIFFSINMTILVDQLIDVTDDKIVLGQRLKDLLVNEKKQMIPHFFIYYHLLVSKEILEIDTQKKERMKLFQYTLIEEFTLLCYSILQKYQSGKRKKPTIKENTKILTDRINQLNSASSIPTSIKITFYLSALRYIITIENINVIHLSMIHSLLGFILTVKPKTQISTHARKEIKLFLISQIIPTLLSLDMSFHDGLIPFIFENHFNFPYFLEMLYKLITSLNNLHRLKNTIRAITTLWIMEIEHSIAYNQVKLNDIVHNLLVCLSHLLSSLLKVINAKLTEKTLPEQFSRKELLSLFMKPYSTCLAHWCMRLDAEMSSHFLAKALEGVLNKLTRYDEFISFVQDLEAAGTDTAIRPILYAVLSQMIAAHPEIFSHEVLVAICDCESTAAWIKEISQSLVQSFWDELWLKLTPKRLDGKIICSTLDKLISLYPSIDNPTTYQTIPDMLGEAINYKRIKISQPVHFLVDLIQKKYPGKEPGIKASQLIEMITKGISQTEAKNQPNSDTKVTKKTKNKLIAKKDCELVPVPVIQQSATRTINSLPELIDALSQHLESSLADPSYCCGNLSISLEHFTLDTILYAIRKVSCVERTGDLPAAWINDIEQLVIPKIKTTRWTYIKLFHLLNNNCMLPSIKQLVLTHQPIDFKTMWKYGLKNWAIDELPFLSQLLQTPVFGQDDELLHDLLVAFPRHEDIEHEHNPYCHVLSIIILNLKESFRLRSFEQIYYLLMVLHHFYHAGIPPAEAIPLFHDIKAVYPDECSSQIDQLLNRFQKEDSDEQEITTPALPYFPQTSCIATVMGKSPH